MFVVSGITHGQANVQNGKIHRDPKPKPEIIEGSLIGVWDLIRVFSVQNGDTTNLGPYWVPVPFMELASSLHFDTLNNFRIYQPRMSPYHGHYAIEEKAANGH